MLVGGTTTTIDRLPVIDARDSSQTGADTIQGRVTLRPHLGAVASRLRTCVPDACRAMSHVDHLWATIHGRLRHLAAHLLVQERRDHTLQPTALVHEAWLRLHQDRATADHSAHLLYRAVANSMRRVLLDHARGVHRQKRTPPRTRLDADQLQYQPADPAALLDLDAALRRLARVSPLHARIVELRFFAGLTEQDVAASLGISRRTVQTSFRSAASYLRTLLEDPPGDCDDGTDP